jgi:glycosyltransferase involved in cell wall biosynthesis
VRIGLNLLHALPEIGGSWNYVANLLAALSQYDHTNTYVVFVTRASKPLAPLKPNFIQVLIELRSISRARRIFYEHTMLQWLARKHQLDCMHWFANTQALINTVPGAVTIYDLQPFFNFANFSRVKRLYLQMMIALTARRAAILLPMSQTTANELQRVLKANPADLVVIPPILNSQFVPAATEAGRPFKTKYRLPEQFWLYVAHLYPHKNHLRLLQAYHQLKSGGLAPWPLVLRGDPAGAELEVKQAITRLNLESDIIMLPRLEEAELSLLFSTATALVFPSLYEGGGIPVVEAMACGCPVIAADIPVVREFAGDAASYFDPLDVEAMGQAMLALQSSPDQRAANRQVGLARAEEFRAGQVVSKLLNAYNRALQR